MHGDYRMGNLIVEGSRLAAVLDWELVHVGAGYEDLAWFCVRAWRFGAPASYGAGGWAASRTSCGLRAGRRHRRRPRRFSLVAGVGHAALGRDLPIPGMAPFERQARSVELATTGRRVCENEWDLPDLLEGA
ncbi:phosphotransferase enzyme family protein [Mycobacterium ulcerans str. Harvey]|uniref:Phosphotransferase enzyme family protein n=1 Tax=Mycobacterium ulcerans str. Harvey TaxID=1299332 RepID=A0ABN0QY43_MYCUL|nr:phosphotransferase enzyme family protein [Mycobacterium ulcerans str. Harvey]